jgi:hypothetical protein
MTFESNKHLLPIFELQVPFFRRRGRVAKDLTGKFDPILFQWHIKHQTFHWPVIQFLHRAIPERIIPTILLFIFPIPATFLLLYPLTFIHQTVMAEEPPMAGGLAPSPLPNIPPAVLKNHHPFPLPYIILPSPFKNLTAVIIVTPMPTNFTILKFPSIKGPIFPTILTNTFHPIPFKLTFINRPVNLPESAPTTLDTLNPVACVPLTIAIMPSASPMWSVLRPFTVILERFGFSA